MRGCYEAIINITSLSVAKTLMYLSAPSGAVVEILSASVTNTSNETNEQLECTLQKVSSIGAPSGTTITPSKLESGDTAAASVLKGDITAAEPSYSAGNEVGREGWPSLGAWRYQPIPEERLVIGVGQTWGIRMLSTPAAFSADVKMVFREIG